ncbi:MAG: hypothetical protein WCT42_01825 [Candidatus Paceibacterota bacterium]|jgi:hypothetical protein
MKRKREKISYEIILSGENKDFEKILHSEPEDYIEIDLRELIKRAHVKGLKIIKAIRIDFYQEDILLLESLGVYSELENGSTWLYTLFLYKGEYYKYLKRKEEQFKKTVSTFANMGWI